MVPTARTPLHHWHASRGARFMPDEGWQLVASYGPVEAELGIAKNGLGMTDISGFGKVGLLGKGLSLFLQSSFGAVDDCNVHQVLVIREHTYSLGCRLSKDSLLVLGCTPDSSDVEDELFSPRVGAPILLHDVTTAYAGFVLLGPHVEVVLRRLTHLDVRLSSFPLGTCAETALARVEALLVRHAEFSVPSMRIYVPWDLGEYVWERILEAGRDLQIAPIGLDALRRLLLVPA